MVYLASLFKPYVVIRNPAKRGLSAVSTQRQKVLFFSKISSNINYAKKQVVLMNHVSMNNDKSIPKLNCIDTTLTTNVQSVWNA
jgi:hypothetical protein